MSNSKSKRTVTVEKSLIGDNNDKAKPSVFARLGPGVQPRKSPSFDKQEICLNFSKTGLCAYGSKCKYQHSRRDRSTDDLRNKVTRKHEEESDSDSKKLFRGRKENDSKLKSTIVVSKSNEVIDDIWPEATALDEKQDQKKIYSESSKILYDKKEKSASPHSRKSKNKILKTSSAEEKTIFRQKSRDRKKRKRNPSNSSEENQEINKDQKRQLGKEISSEKVYKTDEDTKRMRSPAIMQGRIEKTTKQKPKSVENRLILMAMESEHSSLVDEHASREKKELITSRKSKDYKKERSPSSPSKSKSTKVEFPCGSPVGRKEQDKSVQHKLRNHGKELPKTSAMIVDQQKISSSNKVSELPIQYHRKLKSGKPEKPIQRSSSTSSSSSSSSSETGTGSSSDSSSSGSSSSSSSSSYASNLDASKQYTKGHKDIEAKPTVNTGKRESRMKSDETSSRRLEKDKSIKDVTRHKLLMHEESRFKDQKCEKSKEDKKLFENTLLNESQDNSRNVGNQNKPNSERKRDRMVQDVSSARRTAVRIGDGDKVNKDEWEKGTSRLLDSHELSKKSSSVSRDCERSKLASPMSSRRVQSPTESLHSHRSAKPHSPIKDRERGKLLHDNDQYCDDYYRSRDKNDHDDSRYKESYSTERYDKQFVERVDTHGHEHSSLSTYKISSNEKYDRNQENMEVLKTDDRERRYSRDRCYDDEHYGGSPERYNADARDDAHRLKSDYYSGYHNDRRRSRTEESRKDEKSDRHKSASGYKNMESELEYENRDHDKIREPRQFDRRDQSVRDLEQVNERSRKDEGCSDESSRRERTSRRGHWESEHESTEKSRKIISGSRNYTDRQDLPSRSKRIIDDDTTHSPVSKKRREEVGMETKSSRAPYEQDLDKDRSQKDKDVLKDDEHHSIRSDLERSRNGSVSEKRRNDRGEDGDRHMSRRHESREKAKDVKIVVAESVSRGGDVRDSWHRDESSKRHRSPSYHVTDEVWDRNKDHKRSRLDVEEKDRSNDQVLRKEEEVHHSPRSNHSPKPLAPHSYTKHERFESDKRSSDLTFTKLPEDDLESRAIRVKSEEKRENDPVLLPLHLLDDRTRRSPSRGSLSSKKSQRDSRRDDRYYDKRSGYDHYREGHYERLPVSSERIYDRETDRENLPWNRDRPYDRSRPDDDTTKQHRPLFEHDRNDREIPKTFAERGDWDETFRRDNPNYRGMSRSSNWEWERDRPRVDWDNRFDRGNEPADYRARREVLLPPPPRPRTDTIQSSPLPSTIEVFPTSSVDILSSQTEPSPEISDVRSKLKEDDPGYDDISDDELEDLICAAEDDREENQVGKIPVVDILDIKWESLIKDEHPKNIAKGSIVSRFTSHNIFSKIGVSLEFAGENLVNKVKEVCQKSMVADISQSTEDENDNTGRKLNLEKHEDFFIKEEFKEETDKAAKLDVVESELTKFELFDDIANFHMGLQMKAKERVSLVSNIGPYRRALCARRDLAIRRALCKVEKEEIVMFPVQLVDQDLYKQSLELMGHDKSLDRKTYMELQPIMAN